MINAEIDKMLQQEENLLEAKECKGLIYRASVSQYIKDNAIGERIYLKLLKSKSCKGCGSCGWMKDVFQEYCDDIGSAVDLSEVEDGKMYKLEVSVSGGTYEYPDDVDIEFYVKEIKDKK